jgi:hypothetical protein
MLQQAIHSSHTVSTAPLLVGTSEQGNEPTQLHCIVDTVESRLRRAQEETAQATQALVHVQEDLEEKRSAVEQEKLAMKAKWDEEKVQLQ